MAKTETSQPGDGGILSLKFWATLIKELGVPSFLVFFFTMIFLVFGTAQQKQEFVDEFFLFKDVNKNPFPFSFIILLLLSLIVLQYIYYNKIIKHKTEENKTLGREKTELQTKLLNKALHSSEKKK